jgi:triacylglycerol esterase/lipase EstA (alpha/beta hydrolase family)
MLSRHRSEDGTSPSNNSFGPYGLTLLHAPAQPLIDLIFVHGLRGGSVKTWTKSDDEQCFWPQAWLPQEPGLKHVRIHTFGYNSDWGERRDSILNVHDFGKDLLGEMSTNPCLRAQEDAPIILIGHSMGGLGENMSFT